jgi:multiple sugar transport system substrate-binding protein
LATVAGGFAPAIIRAQDAPVEVTFHHIWGTPQGEQAPEQPHASVQLIDAFNAKNLGVKVISRTDTGDYFQNLQTTQAELAAGDPPALVSVPWAFVNWASEGLGMVDLDDVAGDQLAPVLANLGEQVVPLVQIDGKTKGMPFAFSTPVIYYNREALDSAGVDPAVLFSDWTTFIESAQPLKDAVGGGPVLGLLGNWAAQGIIQSNGGRVMQDSGEFGVTLPETVEAMSIIQGIDGAGLLAHGTPTENNQSFLGGSLPTWHGSIASLSNVTSSVNFEFGVSTFPRFGDKKRWMSCGGSFIGMFAKDEEQQQAAFEFEKFAMSEEGYRIWAQVGYLNATKYDIPVLPGQEAAYEQLNEGINAETPWPGPRGGEIADTWNTYVNRIWMSDIAPQEGCEAALEEMQALL